MMKLLSKKNYTSFGDTSPCMVKGGIYTAILRKSLLNNTIQVICSKGHTHVFSEDTDRFKIVNKDLL